METKIKVTGRKQLKRITNKTRVFIFIEYNGIIRVNTFVTLKTAQSILNDMDTKIDLLSELKCNHEIAFTHPMSDDFNSWVTTNY